MLFMGMLLLGTAVAANKVTVEWDDDNRVKVVGADLSEMPRSLSEWQEILVVRVDPPDVETAVLTPPMLGKYVLDEGVLTFVPQFPLQRGLRYRAVFHPAEGPSVVASHEVPLRRSVPTTSVAQIYPTSDVLPENLLKFYLLFSAPMSRGRIYDHIHLVDEAGKEVEIPFLEIDEELWDSEMKRLTLFIDPGRIKRGVKPLEEIGPSLTEGMRYQLIIDAAWHDAEGQRLVKPFVKAFRVGPIDRKAPDPEAWQINVPLAGSQTELKVRFSESMDHALAHRLIRVLDPSGQPLIGETAVTDGERMWSFAPDGSWGAGAYQLRVVTTIEDLAGNQIGKAFEVDLFEEIDDVSLPKINSIDLPFTIE